ncbi:MAG: DUF1996 domain-containing protein [Thermoleophilia bacterium]|nr:DUF1996 domain-containing protein [Thermoleophilia bacterium]
MRSLVLATVVVALGFPGGALAASPPPGGPAAQAETQANFVSVCRFSHRAKDDPIVFPGQPGVSHDHSFFGNTTTDSESTTASLRAGGTTCQRPRDLAAYWVPTLFANGEPVEPLWARVYYLRGTFTPVEPFPSGLRMIAGSAMATEPQGRMITSWSCGVDSGVRPSAEPPACPDADRSGLRLHVRFPSCWDGTNLDSADHRSHMAYAARGRCPASHPVSVPRLALNVRYPVAGGDGIELASGGVYSGHADFFNAWDESALERLVGRCLNALRHCGVGSAR